MKNGFKYNFPLSSFKVIMFFIFHLPRILISVIESATIQDVVDCAERSTFFCIFAQFVATPKKHTHQDKDKYSINWGFMSPLANSVRSAKKISLLRGKGFLQIWYLYVQAALQLLQVTISYYIWRLVWHEMTESLLLKEILETHT